ncbi:MAG: caspase family protein [Bacteroidaceae bacterium]|nr:caspase family protein [Bacteroidaceae bacterium]
MKKIFFFLVVIFAFTALRAETYVVAVGIAKYQHIPSLRLPENDARTMAALFKTKTKNVMTLIGVAATKSAIVKAMSDQFSRAQKGDMVVLYFSGHGYPGGLCPYDMGRKMENALSYEVLCSAFCSSFALRPVILSDACISAVLIEGISQSNPSNHTSDVVLFLSSRTTESSIENARMKNGFFTAYLERGLRGGADVNKDRIITAKEIFKFVSDGVKTISKNRQHPVMWGKFDDNFVMMDWR